MSLMPKMHSDVHNLNNCRLLLAFSAANEQTNKLLPHDPVLPDVSLHVTVKVSFNVA